MNDQQFRTLVIPPVDRELVRLEAVRQGILDGKPLRQIARELGCDEGTIRRDRHKLLLPPDKLQEFIEGRPYEQIKKELICLEQERERQAEQERLREEAKNAPKPPVFHTAYSAERYLEQQARLMGRIHRQVRPWQLKPKGAHCLPRQGQIQQLKPRAYRRRRQGS